MHIPIRQDHTRSSPRTSSHASRQKRGYETQGYPHSNIHLLPLRLIPLSALTFLFLSFSFFSLPQHQMATCHVVCLIFPFPWELFYRLHPYFNESVSLNTRTQFLVRWDEQIEDQSGGGGEMEDVISKKWLWIILIDTRQWTHDRG